MTFTRYEIRWTWYRELTSDFNYVPFNTIAEAKAYIRENKDDCKSDYENDMKCTLCKVVLHSSWEDVEVLERL